MGTNTVVVTGGVNLVGYWASAEASKMEEGGVYGNYDRVLTHSN